MKSIHLERLLGCVLCAQLAIMPCLAWADQGDPSLQDIQALEAEMAREEQIPAVSSPIKADTEIVGLEAAETARIARVERRMHDIEQDLKILGNQVRNLNRSVDDLRRRR